MWLLEPVKKDVRLKNLTIYGQWAGVLAGITLGILYAWSFLEALQYPIPWSTAGLWVNVVRITYYLINRLMLPSGPCFLEIPYLHMRFPWVVTLHCYWLSIALLVAFLAATLEKSNFPAVSAMQTVIIMFTWLFSNNQSLRHLLGRDALQRWDRPMRVGFYIFFAIINITRFGFPFIHHAAWRPFRWVQFFFGLPSIPAILSIAAAALYCTAAFLEHGFVFSQALGGSGVEPMDFTIPGLGPELNSIEGEGGIRL
ncbi:hypothetical protein F5Y07DRAFT_355581 [Xylaria sp. FL0933]|nr:hypothetical protein F5Y07DRAFT_355581 [Xylaria sp. FL0933]